MPENRKATTFRSTERLTQMIAAIKGEKGLTTTSSVITFCIGEVYHKLFPMYAVKRDAANLDPTEIARRRIETAEATETEKSRRAFAERSRICTTMLKGEVVGEGEEATCVFSTYNFDTADEQRVPLDMVSLEFAKHQKVN